MKNDNVKRPVLIVGMEPRITIPVARSLKRHGVPVEVADFSACDTFSHSRAVRNFVRLPDPTATPSEFIEFLVQFISHADVDTLIPATDRALAAVSDHYERLHRVVHVDCPPSHIVQRVLDKSLTLEAARQCGIRVPGTYRASNVPELEALSGKLQFPVVVKPYHKRSETDFKVRYFETYEKLRRAMESDERLGGQVLLQEYCPGVGVGVEMLVRDGSALATFQHRRLKEVPSSGGAAVLAIAEAPDPELKDQALALLRALEWEGVAMVEFRFHRPDRRTALMEVNGRYWGTLSLAIQAGMDFPLYSWQLAHGEALSVPSSYAVGMRWRWTAGYLRRWHGVITTSAAKLPTDSALTREPVASSDDSGLTRDALWDPTDPAPAISETLLTAKKLVSADVRTVLKKLGLQRRSHADAASHRSVDPGIERIVNHHDRTIDQ